MFITVREILITKVVGVIFFIFRCADSIRHDYRRPAANDCFKHSSYGRGRSGKSGLINLKFEKREFDFKTEMFPALGRDPGPPFRSPSLKYSRFERNRTACVFYT